MGAAHRLSRVPGVLPFLGCRNLADAGPITGPAVYGSSNGQSWIPRSSDNYASYIYRAGWGGAGYTAVPGDFDGDGKTDLAVYGTGNGNWWILKSGDGYASYIYRPGWGGAGQATPRFPGNLMAMARRISPSMGPAPGTGGS